MTGKERVQGAVEHIYTDRIPVYCDELFVNTAQNWLKEGMPENRPEQENFFDYDCTELFIDSSFRFDERIVQEGEEQFTVADKFGIVAVRNKNIPGIEYLEHAIKSPEDWERYKDRWNLEADKTARIHEVSYFKPFVEWPTWSEAKSIFDRKRATGRHITLRTYGHWEVLWRIRGFTESLMDLMLNQEMIEDIFEHYTQFLLSILNKAIEQGIHIDSLFLVDDHGSNKGLLFSPSLARQLIIPHYKRISDFLKSKGIYLFLHSCGDIQQLIPDYIEAGVDGINPLQATVMDVVDLKKEYGDKVTFIGNINSRTMFDRDVVFPEIRRKLPIAAKGGGYIFSVDHSVPETVELKTYLDILKEVRSIPVT